MFFSKLKSMFVGVIRFTSGALRDWHTEAVVLLSQKNRRKNKFSINCHVTTKTCTHLTVL